MIKNWGPRVASRRGAKYLYLSCQRGVINWRYTTRSPTRSAVSTHFFSFLSFSITPIRFLFETAAVSSSNNNNNNKTAGRCWARLRRKPGFFGVANRPTDRPMDRPNPLYSSALLRLIYHPVTNNTRHKNTRVALNIFGTAWPGRTVNKRLRQLSLSLHQAFTVFFPLLFFLYFILFFSLTTANVKENKGNIKKYGSSSYSLSLFVCIV